MKIVIQSLPALIGVLLGALATFLTSSAAERSRWRRQQSIRWDDKRLVAYTEYAHWPEAIKRTGRARHRFYVAAKADLGVAVSESSDAYEWQMSKWLTERPEGVATAPKAAD